MISLLLLNCFIISANLLSSRPKIIITQQQKATSSQETDYFPSLVSDEDKESIFDQLGYIPTNLVSVSARRGTGSPLALKTYSLNGGASRRKAKALGNMTPFPTLYWFCCPIVGKAVADMEREGFVGILEQRMMNEPGALNKFIKSHEGYASERWLGLSKEHQEYLQKSERMTEMVRYSGIAGTDFKSFAPCEDLDHVAAKASIKCLHAHYAHYRSQIENIDGCDYPLNIVGEWTHEILRERNKDLIL